MGGLLDNGGSQDNAHPEFSMLSIPTLWTVFIVNFLALGLIWAYVLRSYPDFEAARFWTGSAFAGCQRRDAGGAVLFRDFAAAVFGRRHRDDFRRLSGRNGYQAILRQAGVVARHRADHRGKLRRPGLLHPVYDSMPMRIAVYSLGQSLPLVLTLKLLLCAAREAAKPRRPARGRRLHSDHRHLRHPRGRQRCCISGGNYSVTQANPVQWVLVLALMFLSMALNFGFLLMSMDRLRSEAAELALLDDLTGVANRRHLLQRLSEECARSERTLEPFALLVIDLDGFKTINDKYGHAAGDACLQHFSLMAQTRLRPGDLLARAGGDEFCIVLASCTLSEAEIVARRLLAVCRTDAEQCMDGGYPDRDFDRGRAMDPRDRRLSGQLDRGRRPRALYRQEQRQEPACGLRSRAAAGARARRCPGAGPAQASPEAGYSREIPNAHPPALRCCLLRFARRWFRRPRKRPISRQSRGRRARRIFQGSK